MSDVKSFKMVGGEEVVAGLVSSKEDQNGVVISIRLRRPHILQLQPMGQGQVGLAFIPWTLSNPTIEVIDVPASAFYLMFDPSDQVERQYVQQTSGIALARAGEI